MPDLVDGGIRFRAGGPVWGAAFADTPHGNHRAQFGHPELVTTASGAMRLTTNRDELVPEGASTYVAGMASSATFALFHDGFFEARIRTLANPSGGWGQFSLISADRLGPEINIWDWNGYSDHHNVGTRGPVAIEPVSASESSWHTHGCRREDGTVTFYLDGVQVAQMPEPKPYGGSGDMYLALNGGVINPAYFTTASFEVDWVRVWERS